MQNTLIDFSDQAHFTRILSLFKKQRQGHLPAPSCMFISKFHNLPPCSRCISFQLYCAHGNWRCQCFISHMLAGFCRPSACSGSTQRIAAPSHAVDQAGHSLSFASCVQSLCPRALCSAGIRWKSCSQAVCYRIPFCVTQLRTRYL